MKLDLLIWRKTKYLSLQHYLKASSLPQTRETNFKIQYWR